MVVTGFLLHLRVATKHPAAITELCPLPYLHCQLPSHEVPVRHSVLIPSVVGKHITTAFNSLLLHFVNPPGLSVLKADEDLFR